MDNLTELIELITPIYNSYKQTKDQNHPKESIKIIWDMGKILNDYIHKNKVKPHNLYREIYGKSESNSNIQQKSYIPREFQGRSVRIYKIFDSKEEIDKLLPHLNSFTNFRESMPFFDNPEYKLSKDGFLELLDLLNSNYKSNQVLVEIRRRLKSKKDVSNPRTQRLHELDNIKSDFIYAYKHIYELIKRTDYDEMKTQVNVNENLLSNYSKVLSALTSEDIVCPAISFQEDEQDPFGKLSNMLIRLFSKKNATERNRFRKLIPAKRIFILSEMVYALTNIDSFLNYKRKIN